MIAAYLSSLKLFTDGSSWFLLRSSYITGQTRRIWNLECKSREEKVKIAAKFSLIIDNVGV